jgi:hypothetical protein
VLRERLVVPEPERERVVPVLRDREVVLRERDVPVFERPVVPPVLRVLAARTFSTPSSIFSSASDNCSSVELCSWLGISEVLLNG